MARVSVIGLGLIGGSIAAALRGRGHVVRGFDGSRQSSTAAVERGLVDEAASTLEEALAGADIVLLSIPVLAIIDLLPTVDRLTPADAIILDVGSVKAPIVEVMGSLGGADRAIGGHPLAGNELSGPEAADPALFRGRAFALCPSPRTSARTRERAEALVEDLGAVPIVVNPLRHDRTVARTSHLPQLLSTALALSLERDDIALAGPGLRDMTRLARSQTGMWNDIVHANRVNIADSIRQFSRELDDLSRLVENGDTRALSESMQRGALAVSALAGESSA